MLSMLDRLWRPDLTLEEAQDLMEKGIEEVLPQLSFSECPVELTHGVTCFHCSSHCSCLLAALGRLRALVQVSEGNGGAAGEEEARGCAT